MERFAQDEIQHCLGVDIFIFNLILLCFLVIRTTIKIREILDDTIFAVLTYYKIFSAKTFEMFVS